MDNISALSVMIAAPQGRAGPGIWEQSSEEGFIDFATALTSRGNPPAARVGPDRNAEPPPAMWTAPRLSAAVTVNTAVITDMDVENVVPPQLVNGQEDLLQLIALLLGEEENDGFLCAIERYIQKEPKLLAFFERFPIRPGKEAKLPDLLALLPVFAREASKEDELPPELAPLANLFMIFTPVPVEAPAEEKDSTPVEPLALGQAVIAEQPAIKENAVPADPQMRPVSAPQAETVPLQTEPAQTVRLEAETPDRPEATAPETARENNPSPVGETPDSVRVTELRIASPRRVTYTNPFSAIRAVPRETVQRPAVPGQPVASGQITDEPVIWDLSETEQPGPAAVSGALLVPESADSETARREILSENTPVAENTGEGNAETKPVTASPVPSLQAEIPQAFTLEDEVLGEEAPQTSSPQVSAPGNASSQSMPLQAKSPEVQVSQTGARRDRPAEAEASRTETPRGEPPAPLAPAAQAPTARQPVQPAETPPARQVLAARIIDQIAGQVAKPQDVSVLQMELHPKFLGKIQLIIEATEQGMTARLKSDNQTVRSLLNENLAELKTSLKDAGISMKDIEVTETRVNTQLSDRRSRQDNAEEAGDRNQSGRIGRLRAITAAAEAESAGPVTAAYDIGRVSGDSRFDYRA